MPHSNMRFAIVDCDNSEFAPCQMIPVTDEFGESEALTCCHATFVETRRSGTAFLQATMTDGFTIMHTRRLNGRQRGSYPHPPCLSFFEESDDSCRPLGLWAPALRSAVVKGFQEIDLDRWLICFSSSGQFRRSQLTYQI